MDMGKVRLNSCVPWNHRGQFAICFFQSSVLHLSRDYAKQIHERSVQRHTRYCCQVSLFNFGHMVRQVCSKISINHYEFQNTRAPCDYEPKIGGCYACVWCKNVLWFYADSVWRCERSATSPACLGIQIRDLKTRPCVFFYAFACSATYQVLLKAT